MPRTVHGFETGDPADERAFCKETCIALDGAAAGVWWSTGEIA
jgi:hypothetical protein